MLTGLCRFQFQDEYMIIDTISADSALADASGFGLEDIKESLEYLRMNGTYLNKSQATEALKLMKACFDGYRFPSVGSSSGPPRYNPQLCLKFFQMLCEEENLYLLDAAHDEHWEKLEPSLLMARINDKNSDPSCKMLKMLARYSSATTDLAMLATGKTLEHEEHRLRQRYCLDFLFDPYRPRPFLSTGLECTSAARDFMYDMGIVTMADGVNASAFRTRDVQCLKMPNAIVREFVQLRARGNF